jgi:hypothetical protein
MDSIVCDNHCDVHLYYCFLKVLMTTIIRTAEQIEKALEYGVLSLYDWETVKRPSDGLRGDEFIEPGDTLTLTSEVAPSIRYTATVRVVELVETEALATLRFQGEEGPDAFPGDPDLPWVAIIEQEDQ